jgi:hypothetical protein
MVMAIVMVMVMVMRLGKVQRVCCTLLVVRHLVLPAKTRLGSGFPFYRIGSSSCVAGGQGESPAENEHNQELFHACESYQVGCVFLGPLQTRPCIFQGMRLK